MKFRSLLKKMAKNFAMIQTENFKSQNWWRHNWRLFGVRDFYATEIKWSSVQDIVIFQSSKCNHSNAFIKYDSYISRNAKYIPSISPICSIIFQALIDVALVFIVCTRIHSCTRIIFLCRVQVKHLIINVFDEWCFRYFVLTFTLSQSENFNKIIKKWILKKKLKSPKSFTSSNGSNTNSSSNLSNGVRKSRIKNFYILGWREVLEKSSKISNLVRIKIVQGSFFNHENNIESIVFDEKTVT